jgi:pimeloyl-ACP methyl ester carboxylesterase
MRVSGKREKVRFASGDTECAGWHYPSANGACVIMAGGLGVTKEPGTDPFARRFHEAGYGVLAFDHRRFGESGGRPRQVASIRDQQADWDAALGYAATLPGVDPAKLVAWGFSLAGGHVFRVAARHPELAAAVAQTPLADGPAAGPTVTRHQRPLTTLRVLGTGLVDAVGGLLGRPPVLIPLAAEPGTVGLLSTPDGLDGNRALNPDNRYPDWRQEAAARATLRLAVYRPGRAAARIRCPLLVLACDQDQSVLPGPAARAARRAPRGELVRLPGGHYAPFLEMHERAVEAELSFLRRHVLDRAGVPA